MKTPTIEFSSKDYSEIDAFLAEKIYEFNGNATGYFDAEEFATAIRDGENRIVAAMNGYTWGGYCHVCQLWVHASVRHQGYGKALMLAVETHALSRRCAQIGLATHSFQAPDFYRKLGYVEEARISGNPKGHYEIRLTKHLFPSAEMLPPT